MDLRRRKIIKCWDLKARKEKSVLKLQLVKQIVNRMSMVFTLPGE